MASHLVQPFLQDSRSWPTHTDTSITLCRHICSNTPHLAPWQTMRTKIQRSNTVTNIVLLHRYRVTRCLPASRYHRNVVGLPEALHHFLEFSFSSDQVRLPMTSVCFPVPPIICPFSTIYGQLSFNSRKQNNQRMNIKKINGKDS